MATFHRFQAVEVATTAKIIAWIDLVHDALTGVGCQQTSDTGQIVAGDVADPPPTKDVVLGYRIYELNDSLSATYPVYVKVSFRLAPVGSNAPRVGPMLMFEVGFSTDGAGGISGSSIVAPMTWSPMTNNSVAHGSIVPNSASKTDGFLHLVIGPTAIRYEYNGGFTTGLLFISRTTDSSGAITGDGVFAQFLPAPTFDSTSYPELQYSYLGVGGAAPIGPFSRSCPSLGAPVANGLVAASPSVLVGGQVQVNFNVLNVPLSAVTRNAVISLSVDGIHESQYLVLPVGTGGSGSAQMFGTLTAIPDSRTRYLNTFAVRYE